MGDAGYRLVSLGGLAVMLAIAWALSEGRSAVKGRVVAWGLGLQLILALFVMKTAAGTWLFGKVDAVFQGMVAASDAGAGFVFGKLNSDAALGAKIAFHALPIIIFVAALSAVLYHWGVVQWVIRGMARVMQRTMRISGAEAVAAALFVFMGIESVTAIDKYVDRMTRSELFVVMTTFMATIATSVMAIYVAFGISAGHLLAASLMSAPAAIVIAKIMIPETGTPDTAGRVEFRPAVTTVNTMDAAATGAAAGVKLAINIAAMLIAFVGLVYLANTVLQSAFGVRLEQMMGWAMSGFAAVMGVPREDWLKVGELLGKKGILNEFLAYDAMTGMALSVRARLISTYALCGFANLGSVAILIGGIGSVAPKRRREVAALGIRALVAGTLAAFMTACYAGVLA